MPGSVTAGWMLVIFERQNRFNQSVCDYVIDSLVRASQDVGTFNSLRHLQPRSNFINLFSQELLA